MVAPQNICPHGSQYMSACYRLAQNLSSCTLLSHIQTRSIQCVIYGSKKEMSSFFWVWYPYETSEANKYVSGQANICLIHFILRMVSTLL